MTRLELVVGLLLWAGSALLLSQLRRFGGETLTDRLGPFNPGSAGRQGPDGGSDRSLAAVIGPLAGQIGDRISTLFGVVSSPDERLRRIHSSETARRFRARQMGLSLLALVAAAVVAGTVAPSPSIGLLVILGLPLLVFLVIEQGLERRAKSWAATTDLELPVVEEQMAMLLSAGFSSSSVLARISERGGGCVAQDLRRALNRVAQGSTQAQALGEWAELSGSEGVRRLTRVLSLHSDSADLARLVSAEARQVRRDLHTRTLTRLDRRSEQVWIPVTVAALVPGTILLAVPFLDALRIFANA
ncbi:MAG: type II secretion system F family protein [Acidimicrobiales bacterium]